jgi:poly-gamma-glutamate synthesis protein (capsule biosynthesis protein)
MTVTLALAGDTMLGRLVAEELLLSGPRSLFAPEVHDLVEEADACVVNLECCVSRRGLPTRAIRGKPFFFRAPPHAVEALRAIGVSAVSLANNHALDYGREALADTLALLDAAGIAHPGAGAGPEAARRPCVLTSSGERIGVVVVSDHPREFAATAPAELGIAYADLRDGAPRWLLEEVARMRAECDRLLCFPHWGPNMTTAPAQWQRRLAAELVDAGVDLVAGHSAHVFHGVQRRRGAGRNALIAYDLGDALDDYRVDPDLRNDLGVLALWAPGEGGGELELVALRLDHARTGLARGEDADWVARRLERACAELGTAVERIGEQRFRVE